MKKTLRRAAAPTRYFIEVKIVDEGSQYAEIVLKCCEEVRLVVDRHEHIFELK